MIDVDFFYERLGRLKAALRLGKDKEVAEALGIGEKAFNARKTRGSFPEKELRALAQQRPELGIDVEFVLTGGSLSSHQRQAQDRARRFTLAQPGETGPLLELLDQAGAEMAASNARRADTYQQITEVLRMCSDDTVALVEHLVAKLYRAELAEAQSKTRA